MRPRASRNWSPLSAPAYAPSIPPTTTEEGIGSGSNSSYAPGRHSPVPIVPPTWPSVPRALPPHPRLGCRDHPPPTPGLRGARPTTSCPGGRPPRCEHGQSGARTLRRRPPTLRPMPPSGRRNDKRRQPPRRFGVRRRRRRTSPNGRFTPVSLSRGRYRSRGSRATFSPATRRPSFGLRRAPPAGRMERIGRRSLRELSERVGRPARGIRVRSDRRPPKGFKP
jgi:hypothetical protein